jgi:hypothetical protein
VEIVNGPAKILTVQSLMFKILVFNVILDFNWISITFARLKKAWTTTRTHLVIYSQTARNVLKQSVPSVKTDIVSNTSQDSVFFHPQIAGKVVLLVHQTNASVVLKDTQLNHGQFAFIVRTCIRETLKENAKQCKETVQCMKIVSHALSANVCIVNQGIRWMLILNVWLHLEIRKTVKVDILCTENDLFSGILCFL